MVLILVIALHGVLCARSLGAKCRHLRDRTRNTTKGMAVTWPGEQHAALSSPLIRVAYDSSQQRKQTSGNTPDAAVLSAKRSPHLLEISRCRIVLSLACAWRGP